jgi:hypothetical protein
MSGSRKLMLNIFKNGENNIGHVVLGEILPHPTRHLRYFIFFILDDIPHVSFEELNI